MFLAGLGNIYEGATGFSIQSPAQVVLPLLAVLGGIACVICGVGVWQRRLFAWHLGFGLVAWASGYFVLSSVLQPLPDGFNGMPIWLATLGAVVGAAFWARVWYRQREIFAAE